MSSECVLALEGITKTFQVDDAGRRGRWHGLGRRHRSTFTAVDDVSFAIERGELVGLVGANGAGKSTVLKILSRVMFADRGRVVLNGPLVSLLEVGAGFHPELTARENVHLNGAILGLDDRTVRDAFEQIVALAGVERFVETPVKRFSSGMRVRLGIAVGLHLKSDVVILDEVLSVGDAVFQRRCLEALDRRAAEGARSTLIVSHNMQTIQQLCRRVLVMERGALVFDGAPDDAISEYYARVGQGTPGGSGSLTARTNVHGGGRPLLTALRLADERGRALRPVEGGSLGIELSLDLRHITGPLDVSLRFSDRAGRVLATAEQVVDPADDPTRAGDDLVVRWSTSIMPLATGQYMLGVTLTRVDGTVLDSVDEALSFSVTDPARAGTLAGGLAASHVRLHGDWTTTAAPGAERR